MTKDKALTLALEALENLKEVVAAAQALGIKAGATGKDMRLGESFLHDEAITAIKEALAPMSTTCEVQPERHELQARGEHAAPCARHCEANAFQIEIRRLKAQLKQPEQEPVLQDIEQYRLQMAGISTAAIGYWKESDGILPDYDTVALRDVAELYSKYDALYKARWSAQPEQEQTGIREIRVTETVKQEQEPVLQDIEQYRMQMAGISTAAIGYWKEGDSIHPDYDTLALRDVAKLYSKYDALYKARWSAQPEQESKSTIRALTEQCAALVWERDEFKKQVQQYEKNGVTCQTYRHKVEQPCAECNVDESCTTPPQRTWVGLTEAEREEIENRPFSYNDWLWFYTHAVEAKLKEKNT